MRFADWLLHQLGRDDLTTAALTASAAAAATVVESYLNVTVLHDTRCRVRPSEHDRPRRQYVFIMTDEHRSSYFGLALQLAIGSLLCTLPRYGVTVLLSDDFDMQDHFFRLVGARGVRIKRVPMISWDSERSRLSMVRRNEPTAARAGFFKLHVFNQSEFDEIAAIDADFVFRHNVDSVFDWCHSDMCATPDPRAKLLTGITTEYVPGDSPAGWNAGFFVTRLQNRRGSRAAADISALMRQWANFTHGRPRYESEQRSFNRIWPPHVVQSIPKMFDLQHVGTETDLKEALQAMNGSASEARAFHAKFWELKLPYLCWMLNATRSGAIDACVPGDT